MERHAEREAREEGLRRVVRCEACGKERTEGWNLKEGFRNRYDKAGLDPALFDLHRQLRGMIQHGQLLRTANARTKVFSELGHVQAAAVTAVTESTGVSAGTIAYLSANWPAAVFRCCTQADGQTKIQFHKIALPFQAGKLPQRVCGDARRKVEAGVSFPPKLDPLALPPLQST